MKSQTVYKVVRRTPDGRLVSGLIDGSPQVTYVPGLPARGFASTALFAFAGLDDAVAWSAVAKSNRHMGELVEVWRGRAVPSRRRPHCLLQLWSVRAQLTRRQLMAFFRHGILPPRFVGTWEVPTKAIACSSIVLEERVA